MENYITGLIRTFVPSIIGALGSYLALKGITLNQETLNALSIGLTGLLTAIYWSLAYLLQKAYPDSPLVKFLLGSPKTPEYK